MEKAVSLHSNKNLFSQYEIDVFLFVRALHVCESKGGLYVNVKLHFFYIYSALRRWYKSTGGISSSERKALGESMVDDDDSR